MAFKATIPRLNRISWNVEVERKFNPGPNFASLLSSGRTIPQTQPYTFSSNGEGTLTVLRQPRELIRDTYYDTQDNRLCELGLWVRQRRVQVLQPNSPRPERHQGGETAAECVPPLLIGDDKEAQWNAKLRLGGNFSDSKFIEFDGKEQVSKEVLQITEATIKLEDLRVVSDLLTRRLSWEVTQLPNGVAPSAKMTIVLDEVTEAEAEAEASNNGSNESGFSHTVGEVELFEELVTESEDRAGHEAQKEAISTQRMDELQEFMRVNPGLFITIPKPIGKLTAYDAWRSLRT